MAVLHQLSLLAYTYNKLFNHRFGAAIVAKFDTISSTFNHLNPLCFIHYSDPAVPPSQWNNVRMYSMSVCVSVVFRVIFYVCRLQ